LYMTRRHESTANDAPRNGEHRKMAETDGFEPIKRPQRHLSALPPPFRSVCTPSCTPDDGGIFIGAPPTLQAITLEERDGAVHPCQRRNGRANRRKRT
jgi:hypothetical protein